MAIRIRHRIEHPYDLNQQVKLPAWSPSDEQSIWSCSIRCAYSSSKLIALSFSTLKDCRIDSTAASFLSLSTFFHVYPWACTAVCRLCRLNDLSVRKLVVYFIKDLAW